MTCSSALELISRSLDGDLTRAEQALLDAHLATCATCAVRAEDLRAVKHAIRSRLSRTPGGYVWSRVNSRLDKARRLSATWRRLTVWSAVAMAAIALCVARMQAHESEPVAITAARAFAVWQAHEDAMGMCGIEPVFGANQAAQWIAREVGYRVPAYHLNEAGWRPVAVMSCRCFRRERVGAVEFRKQGRSLWLFVLPSDAFMFAVGELRDCHDPQIARVRHIGVAGLNQDRYLLCAMSDLSPRQFTGVVSQLADFVTPKTAAR